MRQKRCRNPDCQKPFHPDRPFQSWCCPECALAILKHKERKAFNAETRRRKREANQNNRKWWIKKAQTAFNAYIRERDKDRPCISCGTKNTAQWDAGHYRPAGNNSALRFNELNAHRQCSRPCNKDKSGNLVEYRKGLLVRIGQESVDWLETNHGVKRWTIEELKEVVEYYKRKMKELDSIGNP